MQSEDDYLSQDPDYKIVRMIAEAVPPGEKIFAVGQGATSYLPRELLIGYHSAANEVIQDILWTPVVPGLPAGAIIQFDFPAREFRKLRVVLQGSEPTDQWSMAELRVFDGRASCRAIPPGGSPRIPIPGTCNWRSTTVP